MKKIMLKIYLGLCLLIARIVCPKRKIIRDVEADEPAIYITNHSGIIGPVNMCMYYDKPMKPWVISFMFDNKKVAANFAFHDFFFGRSKKHKKFWRFLAKLVSRLLSPLLKSQNPILVYKNSLKIRQTFQDSVDALESGKDIVIFSESHIKYSKFTNKLSSGFAEVARYYYKKTGKRVKFYPVYCGYGLKTMNIGKPVQFDPENLGKEERSRIALHIQHEIDRLGHEAPKHKPVPFVTEDFYNYYSEYIYDDKSYWEFVSKEYSE